MKVYPQSIAQHGLKLAQSISKVKSKKYEIALAPSLLTTKEIRQKTTLLIYAQHGDRELGAYTGSIPLEELKQIGVKGIILNHSEKQLYYSEIKNTLTLAKQLKLKTIVCASTLYQIHRLAQLHPDYLAYEPKKLIGGKVSVTKAKPKLILKALELLKKRSSHTKLVCGAGVHSREDLGQALLLGAEGVLLSHAVVKAKNPGEFLRKMLS
ncbi:triose-phosphate isomerase [Candidatus Woesearchaeota archaeon]|nr:triose-phosphate isomerase [Candidatus Woesearchaeota archaeon]